MTDQTPDPQPFVVDTYRRGGRVGLLNTGDALEEIEAALSGVPTP